MVSLTTSSTNCAYPQNPISSLNSARFSSAVLVLRPQKRVQICRKRADFGCNRGGSFRCSEVIRVGSEDRSWCCRCKKGCESEGDSDLEEKILEFMEKSDKPGKFPTKQELVNSGRLDLVEAIRRRGGWFSLGWEVEDEENEVEKVRESEILAIDFDVEEFMRRVESCEGSGFLGEDEVRSSGVNSFSGDSAQLASSSGRSLEMMCDEEIGVEGILSRLEKERNSSFGVNLGKYSNGTYASSKVDEDDMQFRSDVDRTDPGKNGRIPSSETNKDMLYSHYTRPDMWRVWSNQRAGFQNTEFEAAEILYDQDHGEREGRKIDIIASKDPTEIRNRRKEITHDQIRSRLQDLEVELSSALRLLRSKREETFLKEGSNMITAFFTESAGSSSNELQNLSDAWEFQENEVMNAQEKLRCIRAKLAVLEGKMALAIINAQKIAEEKQKRIEGARKASQLLHTARVVWPNSASEVLLAGSFDGWTTQRKMEKSSSGIFSVCLKLYPGRYEIKFIVDGIWKIDPLRPIVNNNGYENNLLIIT